MRFPFFILDFEKISEKCDNEIHIFFDGRICYVANTASVGIEVPNVNFWLEFFSTSTSAPMRIFIGLNIFQCVHMSITGTQAIFAVDAKHILPILNVFVRGMRCGFCSAGTGCAACPVSSFIGMVNIRVAYTNVTHETATITDLITIRRIDMLVNIGLLVTSGANFPVLRIIALIFTR